MARGHQNISEAVFYGRIGVRPWVKCSPLWGSFLTLRNDKITIFMGAPRIMIAFEKKDAIILHHMDNSLPITSLI